jgi:hypothetical protein
MATLLYMANTQTAIHLFFVLNFHSGFFIFTLGKTDDLSIFITSLIDP